MKSRWDCRKITEVFEGRYFLEVILDLNGSYTGVIRELNGSYTEVKRKLNGGKRKLHEGSEGRDVKE